MYKIALGHFAGVVFRERCTKLPLAILLGSLCDGVYKNALNVPDVKHCPKHFAIADAAERWRMQQLDTTQQAHEAKHDANVTKRTHHVTQQFQSRITCLFSIWFFGFPRFSRFPMFRISGVVVFCQVSNVPDLWDGRFLGYLGFQCFGSFRKRKVVNIIESSYLFNVFRATESWE